MVPNVLATFFYLFNKIKFREIGIKDYVFYFISSTKNKYIFFVINIAANSSLNGSYHLLNSVFVNIFDVLIPRGSQ